MKFYAVGIIELWKPMVERMKEIWREMSVSLADVFLWSIEKVLESVSFLVNKVSLGWARIAHSLGLVSQTFMDIVEERSEKALFPGAQAWVDDMRKGLGEYGKELATESKEAIDAADLAWFKSRDKRSARLKKDIDALSKAAEDMLAEVENKAAMSAENARARRQQQAKELDAIRRKMEGAGVPDEPSMGEEPPSIGAARRAIIGTTRGWRALGVAAGVGGGMIEKLGGIEKAAKETAKNTRGMVSRYGGT